MKLSIIIPVYNTREYLAACLDSVVDNDCGDYEIVIVNDGSTDDSGIIAAGWARRGTWALRLRRATICCFSTVTIHFPEER